MRVPRSEGVANHTGPESCAGLREGAGEALTGESTGQPSSRETGSFRMPTVYRDRKATRTGAPARAPGRSGVVRDPGMCRRSLSGNREISRVDQSQCPACPRIASRLVRIGKAWSRSR